MNDATLRIPNLVIFRDEDDFVEYSLDEEFQITGERRYFHLKNEDDNYNELELSHVILAHKVPIGSVDLARYKIDDSESGKPAVVYEASVEEMIELIQGLCYDYLGQENKVN